MGLKVAVSGKGGVGKTTIAGLIARSWGRRGMHVLAVDADPVNHLAAVLGVAEDDIPTPISAMSELIAERTGVAPGGSYGQLFRMNPRVDDIPEKFAVRCEDNVRLLVLGTIEFAGTGCFCPENAMLRTLIDHLLLGREDYLIVDMEAGLEHLGRGSAKGIDLLLVIVEPGERSIDTARRIKHLAEQIGVKSIKAILNMVDDRRSEEIVLGKLDSIGIPLLGSVPYDAMLGDADLRGVSPISISEDSPAVRAISEIADKLLAYD